MITNKFEEVFDERWDRTGALLEAKDEKRWMRRLDSIARLIEGSSICAAICIEDGKFLIATNLDSIESSEREGIRLIVKLMSFFKDLVQSNGKCDQSDVQQIFKVICKEAMVGMHILSHIIKDFERDEFIQKVIGSEKTGDFRGS